MLLGNNLDFGKNEARNMVVQVLTSAPTSPKQGQSYFDSTRGGFLTYSGAAWTNYATNSDGLGGQAGSYYLSRANHTGTQAAATIVDLATVVKAYTLDSFAAPVANLSLGGFAIVNLADPTVAQGAATKNYVDSQMQAAAAGIDSKPSVRLVSTSNIASLSGTSKTVDGVAVAAGDRVLLVNQSTTFQNGVYVVQSGSWARAVDADQTGEITPGAMWYVEEGTAYGMTQWRVSNTGTIQLGTTAITIVQFGAAQMYTAQNGVLLTGTVFSAQVVAGGGITAGASGLAIDTSVVARKYSANIGDGTSTSLAVAHGLGTTDVTVSVRDAAGNAILVDWVTTNANTVTINFATAPASAAYRATVVG